MKTIRAFAALSLFTLSFPVSAADGMLDVSARGIDPGSVPQGASRVEMLQITLDASCDADVKVDAITVRHEGLGASADIERVYLSDGRRRISRAASLSGNDRTAHLRVAGLIVPRCGEKTISVLADFSVDAASGGEHRIVLETSADISSDALNTKLSSAASVAPARSTPAQSGVITVEYLPVRGTVRYGSNRIISRLKLEADGESDHLLHSITLTNEGSARNTDLRNLRIEVSGKQASATLTTLDGDLAIFTFDPPLLLERNESRVLQVRADVRASARRTIRFILEAPSDLDATIQKQRGARFQ